MKYIIIAFVLCACFSCNRYLDKPGNPTLTNPKSLEDVLLLLDNPMHYGSMNTGSDEFFTTPVNFGRMSAVLKNYYLNWEPNLESVYYHQNYWLDPYKAVFHVNLCLELLRKIKTNAGNQKDYDYAKGAAHFHRAYAFTTIAWQNAKAYNETTAATDLGAVLDLNADALEKLKRSSVEETYKQIIKDLEESLKYLPEYSNHSTRPSQLAANGLLARVYLSMRRYDKALEYSNKVLTKQSVLLNFNNPADILIDDHYPFAAQRYGKEVIFYKQSVDPLGGVGRVGNYFIDTILVDSYDTHDLRKRAYFRASGSYYNFKGSYASGNMMNGICTDEMFLIRAECYAQGDDVQQAMDDLNELLITRWETDKFSPFTAATKEEALQIIQTERKKELVCRGLRWIDIKRLNEEGANISITRKGGDIIGVLPPKDPRFATQLPQVLVDNFGYEQNPLK